MKPSNYRKIISISKKTWKIILGTAAAAAAAGIIFVFSYFHVEKVEVMGSSHYTDEEIIEKVLRGPLSSNSLLAPAIYSNKNVEDITFVKSIKVSRTARNSLMISVQENKAVGCISYLDNYIYFDNKGIFIEGSKEQDTTVPYFDGIQVEKVVMDEKLPVKDTVLNTAVALSTIFSKNDMVPDHIQFDDSNEISLVYGDITVNLGEDEYLEDKMTRAIAILPQLSGEKGVLHMENVTESVKTVTFEAEQEEVTAENWTGGYDENGDYTGDGEYDENGKYVGAKPKTALDYALEAWVGGYDEEGDYTGAGEYDENLNYVGPAPTQETIDAFGDWTGGYNEDGGFDGVSEYDKDGNYVGPNPNADSSSEDSAEDSSDYSDDSSDSSYYYSEDSSWSESSDYWYDSDSSESYW